MKGRQEGISLKLTYGYCFHETVLWSLASLCLASAGNYLLITAVSIRLVFSLILSYRQHQEGGSKCCQTTPYLPQVLLYVFYCISSILELYGLLPGTALHNEVVYRIQLYALNAGFGIAAGINDTRWHILSGSRFPPIRILLNPNIWMGAITFTTAAFGFSFLQPLLGQIPGTQIAISTAIIFAIALSMTIQAIIQSLRPSPKFIWRHYSFILQIILNITAGIIALLYKTTSWEFSLYIIISALGSIAYIWRNKAMPAYIGNKKTTC